MRQAIGPHGRVRRVHQHLVEKQIHFGTQRADRVFNRLPGGALDLLE